MQKTIIVDSLAELPKATTTLLNACKGKKVFAFYGEMGVGKTTFIKALCAMLGVEDVVTSPTFSIVNEYVSLKGDKVFHFDFYRINSEEEAYDLGYEDYFYSDAYCLIEWPEKIPNIIPPGFVKVEIALKGEQRIINIEA